MKKEDKKQQGFSLIEMLVVIFIVVLISATLIVNWRKNEKQYLLQRVAQNIVQDIRKMQDMALNGTKYNNIVPDYSYGLYFPKNNNKTYIIFGDKNRNNTYQSSTADILIETKTIESGIEINSLSSGQQDLNITFSLPDGFVIISPTNVSAAITIKRTGSTCPSLNCKTINIRGMGQISVD